MSISAEEMVNIKNLIREMTSTRGPLFLTGLFADRPPSGIKNRFYFATDTQRFYYDDCDAGWKELIPATHGIVTTIHGSFPGGTTNFLRADGTFAAPAGGGTTKESHIPLLALSTEVTF